MGSAVTSIREAILAQQDAPDRPVDWQAVLKGLDALEQAVAELRALVTRQASPEVGEDGQCLHPVGERRDASTFDRSVAFCGRCGEML